MAGVFQLAPLAHPSWWAPVGRDILVQGSTRVVPGRCIPDTHVTGKKHTSKQPKKQAHTLIRATNIH